MRRTFLLLVLVLAPMTLHAQAPEAEVRATVQRLFDAMRAGDSTAVRAVFHPEARLLTTGMKQGAPVLVEAPVQKFVEMVGMPHDQVYDERIGPVEVRVDDNLATAWMDYAFYLGESFSHCGVNAFQLFREAEGWRIIQITDTRRREPCGESLGG